MLTGRRHVTEADKTVRKQRGNTVTTGMENVICELVELHSGKLMLTSLRLRTHSFRQKICIFLGGIITVRAELNMFDLHN